MPHIELDNALPGIAGLMNYRPETGRPLAELTEVLSRGPSTSSRGERELIAKAKGNGATDLEVHDTVLIAAMFCAANRYVDGPATWVPDDPEAYRRMADRIVPDGYPSIIGIS
ncbi:hypothetical protein LZG04_07740 [Saccharothrix sp. S26]|uniref:hypothetical protein n=1 Tax=Saccharothrix sp. S26 TaxID=2907215 RepID=UPI001F4300A6|nr:hypothetical protein [Saccharothrix sp. S26]MCE6994699.1 hypothetical protein [Saccharothrix sp. S26]